MTSAQTIAWGLILSEVVMLAVFMWLPVMQGERAFFGVRVGSETLRGEGRRLLRRYWLTLIATFILLQALGFYVSAALGQPGYAIAAHLAATTAALIIYGGYARLVRPFAIESKATRFASPLRARRLADYTHIWIEAAVVLLVFATFILLIHYYPRLPEMIPVHWNAAGEPDDWARKSFTTVFFPAVLGSYLQVIFAVLKHDLVQAKMTLPDTHAAEFLQGKEGYLRANMRLLDVARVAIALVFFSLALLLLTTAISEFNRYARLADMILWAILAVMLAGMGYFMWRMKRINNELAEKFGEWYVQRPREEQHWRHGGLTYYNPDDPALVVEKLVGLGYTLNLAHPGIRSRLLLFAGMPLLVVWALVSF